MPRPPALPALPRAILAALALVALAAAGGAPDTDPAAEEARFREAARLRSLALADMEEGNFGRAAEHLETLAEILPENVLPPVDLAICYFRLNRPADALAQLDRAEALAPDNPSLLYTLARVLELEPGRRAEWEDAVERFAAAHPDDPRPWFLTARRLDAERRFAEAVPALERALERDPENLVLMAELLAAAAEARESRIAGDALDAIEDRLDGFEGFGDSLVEYAGRLRELIAAGDSAALRPPAFVVRNLLRPTDLYQIGLVPLTGGRESGEMFPQLDFDPPLPKSVQGGQDIEIALVDATEGSGLATSAVALLVDRRPDREGLLAVTATGVTRIVWSGGRFAAEPLPLSPAPGGVAAGHDLDQDHVSDLVTATNGGAVVLYRGRDSGFAPGETVAAARPGGPIRGLFAVDADHDGDLDLFVARAGAADLFLRNDGSGWSERAAELGLAGPDRDTTDVAIADFDDDGDLDLLTVHPGGRPRLYLNRRTGAFVEAGERWALDRVGAGFERATPADFDNDGRFDLLLWGPRGGLLAVSRGGYFEPLEIAGAASGWTAAAVADLDNDGDQDVAFAAAGGALHFARNRRPHGLAVEGAPIAAGSGARGIGSLLAGDFDEDGDLDLVAAAAAGPGPPRFVRNEGGNRNHWVRLGLVGRTDNNGKNPSQGLFSRVEARLGDHFQAVLGNGGVNHLGLGARRQADVVRVVWTNGLAQTWQRVAADRTMVEEQVLKGSCPFLYAWNGEEFAFVTDLMWKSPLGMLLADGRPAPHASARDFVLLPGAALAPSGGELWLQTTEELWETAYVDRQSLFAVDHPAAADLVLDESFRPPPYPDEPPIHWLDRQLAPVAARDGDGRDVLAEILLRDGRHVDALPLGRYQGVTRGQRLELAFEGVPAGERLRLVLWGWIFPTDTSINRALSQDPALAPAPPALETRAADGGWRRVADFIGFPNGKRKAMVVELAPAPEGGRLELAIPTSMQIYWDAAALAVGDPRPPARVTRLEPHAADLHYRGYSRLYRETPTGPHLFDYAQVRIGPRFADMTGAFTRYGEVTELLAAEDDRYVVMNAGDELTVRFDAAALPPLRPGWHRDWVLYTDGWVKDADINTAHSGTVEPLPYRAMTAYPDRPEHRYPDGPEHRSFLDRYQTRQVTDRPFREALSGPRPPGPESP